MLPDIRAVIAAVVAAAGLLMIAFGAVATFRVAQDSHGALQADLAKRGQSALPRRAAVGVIETPGPHVLPPPPLPVIEVKDAPIGAAVPDILVLAETAPAAPVAETAAAVPPHEPAIGGPLAEPTPAQSEAERTAAKAKQARKVAAAKKAREARIARQRAAVRRAARPAQQQAAPAGFGNAGFGGTFTKQ